MEINFGPIGIIHTPFKTTANMPIQSIRSDEIGSVEVFPEYLEGLEGIEGLSHIILIYVFHRLQGAVRLKVKPFLDDKEHGLFTTRYPNRPNPLGLSVVRLISRKESCLKIRHGEIRAHGERDLIPSQNHAGKDQVSRID